MNPITERQMPLPTPRQIARTPECAILRALELESELAVRALIAAHPELEGHEAPYWARERSETRAFARDIVNCAIKLQTAIEAYFRAVEIQRRADNPDFDHELPF